MGDQLKRDQLEFLYDTVKIIYDCALRPRLVDPDQNKHLIQNIIPQMAAYRAILVITRIIQRKMTEKKKDREREEAGSPLRKVKFEEEEEKKDSVEEQIMKKRVEDKLNTSNASNFSDH